MKFKQRGKVMTVKDGMAELTIPARGIAAFGE